MPEFVMRNYTPPARAYQIEKMYEKFREWNILEQIEIDNPEELDVVLKKSEELELCE